MPLLLVVNYDVGTILSFMYFNENSKVCEIDFPDFEKTHPKNLNTVLNSLKNNVTFMVTYEGKNGYMTISYNSKTFKYTHSSIIDFDNDRVEKNITLTLSQENREHIVCKIEEAIDSTS